MFIYANYSNIIDHLSNKCVGTYNKIIEKEETSYKIYNITWNKQNI